jgi:hypothetical protein
MTRLNTEYLIKLQHLNERREKLRTDAAIFREKIQKNGRLAKELDETD